MHGSCLCGAITFEVSGSLPQLYQCHCSLCRKQGGATSNTATLVQAENFRWLSGESRISSYYKSTGIHSCLLRISLRTCSYLWFFLGLRSRALRLVCLIAVVVLGRMIRFENITKNAVSFDVFPFKLVTGLGVLGAIYLGVVGIGAGKGLNLQDPFLLIAYRDWETDRKSTRLNSSHSAKSRMPSSA